MAKQNEEETQQQDQGQEASQEAEAKVTSSLPTIPVGEDADDGPDDAPEAPETKKGRRAQFREMREKLQRQETELAELRGRISAPQPIIVPQAPAQTQEVDPAEAALDQVDAQKSAVLRALSTPGISEAEQDRLTRQFRQLERQALRIMNHIDRQEEKRREAPREDEESRIAKVQLQTRYPKIFERASLRAETTAVALQIQEQRRAPMSPAIAEEAAAIVYARHGLGGGKAPAPSETEKARHQSTPNRPGGPARQSWTPNRQQMTLAMAYTEHRRGLSDEQRLKVWYDEVGKPGGLV